MPGLNRRGPNNEGPMTGRRTGRCNPENKGKTSDEIMQDRIASFQSGAGKGFGPRGRGLGRGQGRGRGCGQGMRFRGND